MGGNVRRTVGLFMTVPVAAVSASLALLSAPAAAAPPNLTLGLSTTSAPGSLDPSFGSRGQVALPIGSWAAAGSVIVQPDGRIVTAGEADINGQDVIVATRMLSNGRLDSSFGTGGITTVAINGSAGVESGDALALLSNGKILIAGGGRDGQYGPISFAAVRLTPNGQLDQTFGSGGVSTIAIGPYSIANGIAIQPDGKIVLGGAAYANSHVVFAAARLNPDGTVDTGFGSGGSTTLPDQTAEAWGLVLQPDGKTVLAGQANYANPVISNAQQFMAARLNPDGTLDSGFGQGGIVQIPVGGTSLGFGVALQTDGKLLVAGPAYTANNVNAIVRLNPDGTLDPTYGTNGIGTINSYNSANGLTLDGSGRPILPVVGPGAQRFTAGGTPDNSFGSGGSAIVSSSGGANGAAVQSNGAILLAGSVAVGGRDEISVIRLNP